jgi:SAM-dependent methyltransferase
VNVHKVYRVFQDRFRPRRMARLASQLGITADTKILDIGGSELNWTYFPVMPDVTIINVEPLSGETQSRQVLGDGCRLPFGNKTFDLAFSNSVIEHVSDHRAFAAEAARVGRSYYIQTPNFWFPIEPHFLAPIVHYLPLRWRKRIARHFTGWGLIAKPSPKEVDYVVSTTRLLKRKEMQELFPGATLEPEKILGMTKSLIVIGRNP